MVSSPTLLVLLWTLLGLGLRLHGLTLKPVWGDEWSTLVFSLGNGYHNIPFNQPMPLETLLAPLQPPAQFQFAAVVDRLHQESNHPPFFFLLLHLWLHIWLHSFPPSAEGWVSVGAARLLSVCFGVAAIPLTYLLIRRWTRFQAFSPWASHGCAALMALSPFGVYLAQEARHYTLSILWVLALLYFLERSFQPRPLPWWAVFTWIGTNSLGLATHFFYGIGLLAAAGVIMLPLGSSPLLRRGGMRLGVVAMGTIATTLVWLPTVQGIGGTSLTQWLERRELFAPAGRLLLWILTAILMLPVEGVPQPVAIVGAIVLLGAFGLSLRFLWRAVGDEGKQAVDPPPLNLRLNLRLLLAFIGFNLLIVGVLIYGLNNDLSLAPRYQFIYFPALILAFGLAFAWNGFQYAQSRRIVISLYLIALLGNFSVSSNLAFQKSEQSDVFFDRFLAEYSTHSTPNLNLLLVTDYQHHGDIGYLMSLAWQWQQARQDGTFDTTAKAWAATPQFLILSNLEENQQEIRPQENKELEHKELEKKQPEKKQPENDRLNTLLRAQSSPYLIGLINFTTPHTVETLNCLPQPSIKAPGYRSEFYSCDL
jgi:uncharacterized membrane protein